MAYAESLKACDQGIATTVGVKAKRSAWSAGQTRRCPPSGFCQHHVKHGANAMCKPNRHRRFWRRHMGTLWHGAVQQEIISATSRVPQCRTDASRNQCGHPPNFFKLACSWAGALRGLPLEWRKPRRSFLMVHERCGDGCIGCLSCEFLDTANRAEALTDFVYNACKRAQLSS